MKKILSLLLVCLGGALAGCAPGSTAAGSALVHSKFPYAVTYDDERTKSILGPEWTLENYRRVEPDRKHPELIAIERKKGYETTYRFDFNDNGQVDGSEVFPNPDLLLVSRKTEARIEVSTLLLDKRVADKELRVLLNSAVESASGTLSLFVGFGSVAVAGSQRFASRLIDSQEVQLGSEKGLVATIERANLDQLQLNPNARWRRSRLFLMRAPFSHFVAAPSGRFEPYRVLLLVEYSNVPEDFEAQYPEFLRLMNKIHLMNDDMLVSYLTEQLASCSKDKTDVTSLVVDVTPDGKPVVRAAENVAKHCAQGVIAPYRFVATGQSRALNLTYNFTRQLRPDWLSRGEYTETRPTPPSSAPAPTPAGAGATPPAPSTPVAPEAPAERVAPGSPAPATPARPTSEQPAPQNSGR